MHLYFMRLYAFVFYDFFFVVFQLLTETRSYIYIFISQVLLLSCAQWIFCEVLSRIFFLFCIFIYSSILPKHSFLTVFMPTDAGQGFLSTTTIAQTARTSLDCSECRAFRYIQGLICLYCVFRNCGNHQYSSFFKIIVNIWPRDVANYLKICKLKI